MYSGETNGLDHPSAYHNARRGASQRRVCWTTPGLTITRLRLVSDPGFPYWDVSYCHGVLHGVDVNVILPFGQLRKPMAKSLIAELNRDGVNGKRINIWNAVSTLI